MKVTIRRVKTSRKMYHKSLFHWENVFNEWDPPRTALVNFHFMSISAHLSYLQKYNYMLPTTKLERLKKIVNEILDHDELIEIFSDDFELDESVQYNLCMLR